MMSECTEDDLSPGYLVLEGNVPGRTLGERWIFIPQVSECLPVPGAVWNAEDFVKLVFS